VVINEALTGDGSSGAKSDQAKACGRHKWGQKDARGRTSGTHGQTKDI